MLFTSMIIQGLIVTIGFVVCATSTDAPVRFARGLADNMVLQQGGTGASMWGYATTASTVSISVEVQDRVVDIVSANADKDGMWKTVLPPQPPGFDLYTVTATVGTTSAILRNILFGDVWVIFSYPSLSSLLLFYAMLRNISNG